MDDITVFENYLKEENLQEFDPITSTLIYGSVAVAINLTLLLLSTKEMMKAFKDDPKLSKLINNVLGESGWKVKVIKEKVPNAMVIGPKAIFITTGLINVLNERELIAIMLHEAYHVKDYHVVKEVAVRYPLFYIVLFIMFSTGIVLPWYFFFINILLFNIMINILIIPYNITIGRKHESDADAYSIKYGYGDDMISALNKMEKWYQKEIKKDECGAVCRAIRKIDVMIDEHPSIKKRIEYILKEKELAKKIMKGQFKIVKNYILNGLGVNSEKEIGK